MSRYRVVAVVTAALILAVLLARSALFHSPAGSTAAGTPSRSTPSAERSATAQPGSAEVPRDDRTIPDALPADYSWGIAAPTAAWMTATANALVVDPVLEERRQKEEVVTSAGRVIQIGGAHAQFTVYIPPGALAVNETLTVTPLQSVSGLSLARSDVSAIQIAPAHLAFLKPVAITIEPRRRNPRDATPAIAGIVLTAA